MVATVLCALVAPTSALGHATLVGAEPPAGSSRAEAPQYVRLVFRTAVEGGMIRVQVRRGGEVIPVTVERDRADDHAVSVRLGQRATGRYSIEWRALSIDGHASAGTYEFAVGKTASAAGIRSRPTGDPGVATVLGRTLLIAGLVGLAGLGTFMLGVVRPALGALREDDRAALDLASAHRRWRRACIASSVAAGVGLATAAAGLLRALGGVGVSDLAGTRIGNAWVTVALALVVAYAVSVTTRARASSWSGLSTAMVGGGGIGLVALSWSGHAGSGSDASLGIAMDAVHALATASWLGALAGLALLLPALRRGLAPEVATRVSAAVVVRFSTLAVVSVALLVVTGAYRTLAEVGRLGALFSSAYGRVLVVKLGIFVVLLAVGAVNRFVVHPRLERAAIGLSDDERGASALLRRSVAIELALGAALLIAVGALVSISPPR